MQNTNNPNKNEGILKQILERENYLQTRLKEKLKNSLHKKGKKSLFSEKEKPIKIENEQTDQRQDLEDFYQNSFEDDSFKDIDLGRSVMEFNPIKHVDNDSSPKKNNNPVFKDENINMKKDFNNKPINNRYDFIFDESLDDLNVSNRQITKTPL